MTRYLPIVFLLSVTCLLLSASSVSAQENSTANTTGSQVNPQAQGNVWDDFIKNLIPDQFKQIPDTLQQINCSKLPSEACDDIKSATTKAITNPSKSSLNPEANDDTAKKEVVSDAAGHYTIASGEQTPPEISQASTNIFSDLFADITNAFNIIFKRGEDEAQNYAGGKLPLDVSKQNFAQSAQNISGIASEKSNVLGAQIGETAMDRALPLVQCADLPAGLCGDDNKPNFAKR